MRAEVLKPISRFQKVQKYFAIVEYMTTRKMVHTVKLFLTV